MNAVKELFIPFENDPLRLGRLSLYETHAGLEVHIDIVFEESRKIYQHLTIIRSNDSEDEVIQNALIELRQRVAKK